MKIIINAALAQCILCILKFMSELVLILFITIGLWLKMFHALNLVLVLKQGFNKLINGKSQTN